MRYQKAMTLFSHFNMKHIILKNWKEYAKSSLITFAAAAAMAIAPHIDKLSLESLRDGALVGIVFVAIRAGVKALIEAFLAWYMKK